MQFIFIKKAFSIFILFGVTGNARENTLAVRQTLELRKKFAGIEPRVNYQIDFLQILIVLVFICVCSSQ